MDQHTETWSSPSVKGKKDLARSRASKWVSKPESEGVRKIVPNANSVWTALGKYGGGECFDEGFQFATRGQSEVRLQSRWQNCGEDGGDLASSRDRLGRQVETLVWREVLPAMAVSVRGEVLQPIVVRCEAKPSGDKQVLVLPEDHSGVQAYTSDQNPCRGEGAGYGSVGAADEDSMDGVEIEEGGGEFGLSV